MFRQSPLLSRLMAVLLLAAVVAAAWIAGIEPLLDRAAAYRDSIARSERLIAEFEARRVDVTAIRAALETMQRDEAGRRSFIDARNSTLAAARVQSRIKALTEAAGARLVSTQVVASDDREGAFPRVVVRTQTVGTVEAMRQIFHALESGRPFLFLDNVTVTARRVPLAAGGREEVGESGLLTVRYDVFGYLWTDSNKT